MNMFYNKEGMEDYMQFDDQLGMVVVKNLASGEPENQPMTEDQEPEEIHTDRTEGMQQNTGRAMMAEQAPMKREPEVSYKNPIDIVGKKKNKKKNEQKD